MLMPDERPLPQQATVQALRSFIVAPSLWTMYSPLATPATAIYTGYALSMGVTEAQVAFLVGLSGLMGVWQLFSFHLGRRVGNKPRFVLAFGPIEITMAAIAILVVVLAPQYRYGAMAACLIAACLISHTINPITNNWLSNVLPSNHRGPFIGRQMSITTVVSMIHLYLAGLWIDYRQESYQAFLVIFALGWLAGIAGYVVLGTTPYPHVPTSPEDAQYARRLLTPLRSPAFRRLCLYLVARLMPLQMSSAFFGVYMINYLKIPYTTIAIYTNLSLLFMMIGYLAFGALAQRYGSKPIMQILGAPVILTVIAWALVTVDNASLWLPIVFSVNGLAWSGIFVATSNLLFKIVPKGQENSAYFGVWMAVAAIASGVGPFVGGLLRNTLPEATALGGHDFNSIQIVFLLSGVLYAGALLFAAWLIEDAAASPGYLLGQFRGNLLSFVYNSAVYLVAREDETRATAIRGLGRSGSPLALGRLINALGHVSHQVRAEAALGIGEGRFTEAVDPLIEALADADSDIRPEAAQALGQIGSEASLTPLLEALKDPDIRVRVSAVQALSYLPTPTAREALLEMLQGPFDHSLFPPLVDAAARSNDLRIVEPALAGLKRVTKPVVRLQVINAVCRVLGEKNHFYRIATADELARAGLRAAMMQRVQRVVRGSILHDRPVYPELKQAVKQAIADLENDNDEDFAVQCRHIAEMISGGESLPSQTERAAYAIITYLEDAPSELLSSEGVVFLIVCLTSMARHLPRKQGLNSSA
jgi:HEAT repeat protein